MVYVLGSINMDYVIEVNKSPKKGETVSAKAFTKNPGGKGANQAIAIANNDIATTFIAAVGNDLDGNLLLEAINSKNINTDHVLVSDIFASGKAFIVLEKAENSIIVYEAANQAIKKSQIDQALLKAMAGDYFVTQLEIDLKMIEYGLSLAKEKNLITVLNPSPVICLDKSIYQGLDYLILNETECFNLSGIKPKDDDTIIAITKFFKDLAVKNIIITLGSKGVAFYDGTLKKIASRKVKAVDTTAAGDTFLGAFVSALINNNTIEEACVYGNLAASITVTRLGAQYSIPTKSEIQAIK
ncbi:MAG: ribokinase [Tenericutes bacterium]|nr:ribokinase [Mycoplasmatota bacterium]